jgi:hypothetical protein
LSRAAGGNIGKPKHSNFKIHLLGDLSNKDLIHLVFVYFDKLWKQTKSVKSNLHVNQKIIHRHHNWLISIEFYLRVVTKTTSPFDPYKNSYKHSIDLKICIDVANSRTKRGSFIKPIPDKIFCKFFVLYNVAILRHPGLNFQIFF